MCCPTEVYAEYQCPACKEGWETKGDAADCCGNKAQSAMQCPVCLGNADSFEDAADCCLHTLRPSPQQGVFASPKPLKAALHGLRPWSKLRAIRCTNRRQQPQRATVRAFLRDTPSDLKAPMNIELPLRDALYIYGFLLAIKNSESFAPMLSGDLGPSIANLRAQLALCCEEEIDSLDLAVSTLAAHEDAHQGPAH